MNTQSNAIPGSPLESQVIGPAVIPATRRMYWSVRRELWENRSIYIAPLVAAAVYLVGFLISQIWVPRSLRELAATHSTPQLIDLAMPYSHAAMLLMATAFLVVCALAALLVPGRRQAGLRVEPSVT